MAEQMRRKGERAGEKSTFSITCSLLSQYLKEKGSFGKLGLELHAPPRPLDHHLVKGKLPGPPTTMTLLPGAYVSDDDERAEDSADHGAPKSMDLFPRHAGFGSPINTLPSQEEPRKTTGNKEVERAQLTIFYGGKVMVFDNFPSDKAMDLVQTCSLNATPPAPSPAPPVTPVPAPECTPRPPLFASTSPAPALVVASENRLAKPEQAIASDMPIARRNSLHRFLEKRKDRITTKAPYEVRDGSPARPDAAKPESSKSWLPSRPDEAMPESSMSWLSTRSDEAKLESSKSWLSVRPEEAKPDSSKSWLTARPEEAEGKPESSKSWLGLGRQVSQSENSSRSSSR